MVSHWSPEHNLAFSQKQSGKRAARQKTLLYFFYIINAGQKQTNKQKTKFTLSDNPAQDFLEEMTKNKKTPHTFPAVLELISTQVSAALSQKMPVVRWALWATITGTDPYKAIGLYSSYWNTSRLYSRYGSPLLEHTNTGMHKTSVHFS